MVPLETFRSRHHLSSHGGDLVSTWVAKQCSAYQGPVTLLIQLENV